jgi:hypothetical protein
MLACELLDSSFVESLRELAVASREPLQVWLQECCDSGLERLRGRRPRARRPVILVSSRSGAARQTTTVVLSRKSRAGSPYPPGMSPGNTARPLSALASPASQREFLRTTRENHQERTTSGAPLRRDLKIAEASCTRNIKTACGKPSGRGFLKLLHKKHANRVRRSKPARLIGPEGDAAQSAACGSPRCRAYPPQRSCGRVAEGGGLLNRYRVVKPYRGFESLRLRQFYDVSGNGSRFLRLLSHQSLDVSRLAGVSQLRFNLLKHLGSLLEQRIELGCLPVCFR